MNEYIIKTSINGSKLTGEVKIPDEHCNFFKTTKFFANYDSKVSTNVSIINIPLLASVLPLAWLTGSDVKVDATDNRFKESMDKLQQDFKKTFPLGTFQTKIKADRFTDNKIDIIDSETSTALLFSGGVDSTYSMITNLHLRPRLLMIWGVDNYAYPENKEQWNYIYSIYSEQAKKLDIPINLIKTNISQILDIERINHEFHQVLYQGSFRFLIQHSLILLPLMAPLSIGRFNTILIASSAGESHDYQKTPWGSSPQIDEKMVWADLDVKHDGAIDRTEKISGEIKTFLKENQILLKVCQRKLDRPELNDCLCDKCFRTVMTLILSGVDPNTCGFNVDGSTFRAMKEVLSRPLRGSMVDLYLVPIQNMIPHGFKTDIAGSKEFFEWFRNYEIKNLGNLTKYRSVYYYLDYPYAKVLDSVYLKLGLQIHEHTAQRT